MTERRLLVLGGMSKHIPVWISSAFIIEHYQTEIHFKREIAPNKKPDAVICLKSFISHKQSADARTYAIDNGLPYLVADGGWSSVVQKAAEQGLSWFTDALTSNLKNLSESDSKEVDNIIERAWESAYKRQYDINIALEKRYKKDRLKFEAIQDKLNKSERRTEAAGRVIDEVKEAVKKKEESEKRLRIEIDKFARSVDSMLVNYETSIKKQLENITALRSEIATLKLKDND